MENVIKEYLTGYKDAVEALEGLGAASTKAQINVADVNRNFRRYVVEKLEIAELFPFLSNEAWKIVYRGSVIVTLGDVSGCGAKCHIALDIEEGLTISYSENCMDADVYQWPVNRLWEESTKAELLELSKHLRFHFNAMRENVLEIAKLSTEKFAYENN